VALTHFKMHFYPERYVGIGRDLHIEKEMISCYFKTCSVQMQRFNEGRRAFSCIGYSTACRVGRPHSPGHLKECIYRIAQTQRRSRNFYSGRNCDHKSRVVVLKFCKKNVNLLRKCILNEGIQFQDGTIKRNKYLINSFL
jgi:hypothetical protein